MLWFARDGAHYFVTALDGSLSLRFVPASVSDDDPEGADCPLFVLAQSKTATATVSVGCTIPPPVCRSLR